MYFAFAAKTEQKQINKNKVSKVLEKKTKAPSSIIFFRKRMFFTARLAKLAGLHIP